MRSSSEFSVEAGCHIAQRPARVQIGTGNGDGYPEVHVDIYGKPLCQYHGTGIGVYRLYQQSKLDQQLAGISHEPLFQFV